MPGIVIKKEYDRDMEKASKKIQEKDKRIVKHHKNNGNYLTSMTPKMKESILKHCPKKIWMHYYGEGGLGDNDPIFSDENLAKDKTIWGGISNNRELTGTFKLQKAIRRHFIEVFKRYEIKEENIRNFFKRYPEVLEIHPQYHAYLSKIRLSP